MAATIMDPVPLAIQPVRRSLRARLVKCVVMLVIFVAGGVAGYSVGTAQWLQFDTDTVVVSQQPSKFTEFLLKQLKKDLALTDEQYPKVERIITKNNEGFDAIRRQTQPLFEKQMAKLEREMLAVLTPDQWTRYKAQLDRLKSRHSRSPGTGGGGPPRMPGKDGFRGPGHREPRPEGGGEFGPGRGGKPSARPELEKSGDKSLSVPPGDSPAAKPNDKK